MLFWYSQSISPAREIQTSSSGPKNQQAENLYGLLVG
jgi:hypothetical protein